MYILINVEITWDSNLHTTLRNSLAIAHVC